jgi:hypothetical protein
VRTRRFWLKAKIFESQINYDDLVIYLIDQSLVGCLLFTGTYSIHIQAENKMNDINKKLDPNSIHSYSNSIEKNTTSHEKEEV